MAKTQRVKKPHPVRHSLLLVLTALLMAVFLAASVSWSIFGGIVETLIGGATPVTTAEQQEAVRDSARAVADEVQREGMVLLQNRDAVLPLSNTVKKVNVFGWASIAWLGGGSGSGGVSSVETDLLQALADYGVETNTALTDMYRNFQSGREYTRTLGAYPEQSGRLYEPSVSDKNYYSDALLSDAEAFSDTAFVVIGRLAGESNDATKQQYKRTTAGGDIVVDDARTMLDLSTEEIELLTYVGAQYGNVVVLINSTNVMALGPLETIPGIDAVVLAGLSGQYAAEVIPAVLWGEVSPSGRTADTFAYDLSTAATYATAGLEGVGRYTGADGLYPMLDGITNGNLDSPAAYTQVSYLDYIENIYVGYRWYETADAEGYWDGVQNEYGADYDGVVQYPFGYGLSYTDFSWEVVNAPETALTENGTVAVTVKVTNTGSVAGKDVVELYYTAPYTKGGIEKSAVELAAFEKTKLLQPGESEELTLTFAVRDMASYDGYDKNGNGFAGYELDPGTYTVSLRRDAHAVVEAFDLTLAGNVQYPTDAVTGAAVSNKFTGADAIDGVPLDGEGTENITYLSRADFAGTFPKAATPSRPMADSLKALNLYTADMADAAIDPSDKPITTGARNGLALEENGLTTALGYRLGSDYDAPEWDALLDQLSIAEMTKLFTGAYSGIAVPESAGMLRGKDADGPSQIGGFTGMSAGTGFPSSSTLAQTWNKELAHQVGLAIGREALQSGYTGWYAPATNLHRSPFNGRNYEYYSEDGFLSGEICGNTVMGANEAGVYTYVKHFVCNDGEAGIYRDSVYIWMPEQALREIYLQPFQMLVEQYDAVGFMSSYNRIGAVWAGGSKALLTGVLRDEWNFKGAVITDYADHHQFMNGDQALRAGGSLWMSGATGGSFAFETSSATFQNALRRAAKETLYMMLHVRAVNRDYANGDATLLRPQFRAGMNLGFVEPLFIALAVVFALLALWCIVLLVRDRKLKKAARHSAAE